MAIVSLKRERNTKPQAGAMINWAHPLASGLIAYWAFYEGGGSSEDLVRHIRLTSQTPSKIYWTTGIAGPCLTSDASLSAGFSAESAYALGYIDVNVFSIGARIKKSNATAVESAIYSPNLGAGEMRFDISRTVDGDLAAISTSVAAIAVTSTAVITNGVWADVMYTRNTGTNNILYANGVAATLTTNNPTAYGGAAARLQCVGTNDTTGTQGGQFPGQIDYVAIWNRVLSVSEVQQMAINPYVLLLPNPGIVSRTVFSSPTVAGTARRRPLMGVGS